jgi:hypothetical protein
LGCPQRTSFFFLPPEAASYEWISDLLVMGVQGAKPPAGVRGVPAFSLSPKGGVMMH